MKIFKNKNSWKYVLAKSAKKLSPKITLLYGKFPLFKALPLWIIGRRQVYWEEICMTTITHFLTLSWGRPLSYRNQSIDLLCRSIDWFLYDNGFHHEKVKNIWDTHVKFKVPWPLLSESVVLFLPLPIIYPLQRVQSGMYPDKIIYGISKWMNKYK